jgi:hypothetical protein
VHFNLNKLGIGLIIFGTAAIVGALVAGVYLSHQAESYCQGVTPNLCRQWSDWVSLGQTTMWIGFGFVILGAVFVVLSFKFKEEPRAALGGTPSSASASPVAQTTVVLSGLGTATPQVTSSSPERKCSNCGEKLTGVFCAGCGFRNPLP